MNTAIRTRVNLYTTTGVGDFITFKGLSDDKEHFAIIYNKADSELHPLVRVHSECITGDIFNSEHCDCGDQLQESINIFSQNSGILLYLRQEGRGIGLYNKIDAYKLQALGVNTFRANELLNLPHDIRDFSVAAQMLKALNISQIKLLTNNPKKREVLEKCGILISQVINTSTFEKAKNKNYLLAKRDITGHNFNISA